MHRIIPIAISLFASLAAVAQGQTYCAPAPVYQSVPVVTYYAPSVVQSPIYSTTQYSVCSPAPVIVQQRPCATVYYAPATTCYAPGYSGPGHAMRPPLSTTITVLNSSDRTISGLQVMYLDRTGLRHESARFSIAPGDKKRIENLPETPNEGQDNVLIAIFSEDGSIQKGRDVGIPKGKVFQHYCNDGTVAIGLSVP